MDVRCPACTTEFEFDDSRVTARGVRVKCTDCGHMFTVRKRTSAASKGGTPPPRKASGGTARAASGLAASLAAVAPRTRSRIEETRGPTGLSKRIDASASKALFPDLTEQRQLSRPWMVRSVNQDVMTFRDMSTLQKWIMEGRISRADELSRTGATWRSLADIAELDSMFRVQRSVEEGRRQSSQPGAADEVSDSATTSAKMSTSTATGTVPAEGRPASAFETAQSLPPPPLRPTDSGLERQTGSWEADSDGTATDPDLKPSTSTPAPVGGDPGPTPRPSTDVPTSPGVPAPVAAAPPRPETDDGVAIERDEFPSFDDGLASEPHPMPPDMDDDDEPETVEFVPPADGALPSLIPDDPDPHLAGLAAGGIPARQSIAPKWNEASRQPSWTEGQPNPRFQNPQDPSAYPSQSDLGQATPVRAMSVAAPGAALGASAVSSGVWAPPGAGPSSATGAPGPAASGAWSSSLELRVPSLGPRAMTSPAADAFGAFDADTYFDVDDDDGPDLFMIGVAVTGIILLGIIVLLLLRGPPTRPETVPSQPVAVNLQPDLVRGGVAAKGDEPVGKGAGDKTEDAAVGKPPSDKASKPTADAKAATSKATPAVQKPVKKKATGYDAKLGGARRELMRGRAAKALNLYEQAARSNTRSPEPLAGMGWSYVNLKKPHIAVLKFQQALTKSSRYGDAYIGLGKAYRMMGKTAEARRAYERYLEIHPAGPSASIARNAIRSLEP